MLNRLILPLWILGGIFLLLYSYTQVDLSLTLSQVSIYQHIQKGFQYVGWFERPLSTYLYLGILIYLFSLFTATIWLVLKNKLPRKTIWLTVIVLAVILTPAYNAFSYDLFNYIFDARIVSHYGQNPYEFRPLDFPEDPMLSFMRSTHRVYPYAPIWLGITVPLTYIGSEIFLLTLALFKILGTLCFLGTAYFVGKIGKALKFKNINLAIILFALNPLVLIEGLVSSHNEIVMMFFATLAVYLLITNKYISSFGSLIISIGVKYSTFIILPVFAVKLIFKKLKDMEIINMTIYLLIAAVFITSVASGQNKNPEFQPWYLLLAAPLIPFSKSKLIKVLFFFVSFFSLLSYVPLLYTGSWPDNIVMLKNYLLGVGLFAGIIFYYLIKGKNFESGK